jgi:hypothetical protein
VFRKVGGDAADSNWMSVRPPQPLTRPELLGVDTSIHGDAISAEVVLRVGEETAFGHVMRPLDEAPLAVASATLMAVSEATGVIFETKLAESTVAGDTPLAIVIIEVPVLGTSLVGCVIRRHEDRGVYAKAALDAINRLVSSPHLVKELARRSLYS